MAAEKKSSKSNKGITKSGFIRGLPDRTPAKEVIAKAKEAGLELNEKFVWTVQSEMRSGAKGTKPAATSDAAKTSGAATISAPKAKKSKKNKKKSKTTKRPAAAASAVQSVSRAPSPASAAEQRMKAIIVELGTARADEVYRSVRKDLDALVST